MHNKSVSRCYYYDLKLLEFKLLVPLDKEVGGGRDQSIKNDGLNHPVGGGRPLWGNRKR